MNIESKKYLYRQKALKHYYDNIEYYRNYYALNKIKLIEYSKFFFKSRYIYINKHTI